MEFEKNTLLFGADLTPRIVAVELGESGTVRVHRRETDGSTVTDVEPFHPFVWADSDVVDLGIETEKLQSDLKYGWLITVDSWKELIALRNGLRKAGRAFFAFNDPVQHYLTATGRTLFKELALEELKRMQLEEGLVYGVALYDDYPVYIEAWLAHRPRGLVVMPLSAGNRDFCHPNVIAYDGSNVAEVERAMRIVFARQPGEELRL